MESKDFARTEELIASDSILCSLLNNSTEGIIVLDAALRFSYQSPAVEHLTGINAQGSLYQDFLSFIYPEDRPLVQNAYAEALQHPATQVPFLFRLVHQKGNIIWVQGTLMNLLHEPNIRGFVINFRDITTQKSVETQLEKQNHSLVRLLDTIPDGFFTTDKDWNITYWNAETARISHWSKEQVIGTNLWACFPQSVAFKFYAEIHRALAEQVEVHFEEYFAGLNIWLQLRVCPTEEGLAIYFRDITLKKVALQENQIIKERFDIVDQTISDAIWSWDLVTNDLLWGKGFQHSFGYEPVPEHQGVDCWVSHIHPEDLEMVLSSVQQLIDATDDLNFDKEYRYIKADGTVAHVHDRGIITRNEEGKALRFIGAMQDITLRKNLELEKEKLINHLTQSNKDIRQFNYIISHNLRAPLSNLRGLLNMVKDIPVEDPTLGMLLEGIDTSTNRINDTINDLLQALIIKDNPSIHQQQIPVADVLEQVLRQVAHLIQLSQPEITTDLAAAPIITFNRAYLESIILNLVTNAVKYRSPDRPLKIHIATQLKGEEIILTFKDNGIGLDVARYKDRIFGLYQKFHHHADSKGLGLYLVKSQIEGLGGSIAVESEPNRGALFILKFVNQLITKG